MKTLNNYLPDDAFSRVLLALIAIFSVSTLVMQLYFHSMPADSIVSKDDGKTTMTYKLLASASFDMEEEIGGEILADDGKIRIIGFEDRDAYDRAYETLDAKKIVTAQDDVLSVADDVNPNTLSDTIAGEIAFDRLEQLSKTSNLPVNSSKLVALIDTGAIGDGVESVSVIGEDARDDNGHGTRMLTALRSKNPQARVLSIKAFDSNGRASVSTVYAAIEYALSRGVDIINLSCSAPGANAVLEDIIGKASDDGIAVAVAAGNNGEDAIGWCPANVDPAITVGACGIDGKPIPESNYGTCVDMWVEAANTSTATAIFSGWLSLQEASLDLLPAVIKPDTQAKPMYEDDLSFQTMATKYSDLTAATYIIQCEANTSYVVDVAGGNYANGTNIDIYTANNTRAQQFAFVKITDNKYAIKASASTGYGLDVSGGTMANGTNVQLYTYSGNDVQQWWVDKNANGSVSFSVPKDSTYGLSNANHTYANGNNVRIWKRTYETTSPDTYGSTLEAQRWKLYRARYTVKYNGNGSTSGTMSNQTIYMDTSTKLTSNAFTRTGYTFGGWAKSASGAKAYSNAESVKNLTTTNAATVNLYAVWTANTYSVKYNANGGSGTMANSSHIYGTAKALTANAFTRTGYTFSGWNTKADGSGTAYANKASVKNLTATNNGTFNLYAQWTAHTYSVKYNGNGSTSGTMANSTHTYGIEKTLTANAFKRTGYTFSGWNTKADGSGTAYANKASVKNLTATDGGTFNLYAQWTANTYTVQYNGNGSTSGTMANSTHTYGIAKALTANAFVREGYTFSGWATSSTGAKVYNDRQSVTNLATSGTVNLYAVWTPNVYYVNYQANGGEGTMANSTHTYGVAKTLNANAYTKTGFNFLGWAETATATTPRYSDQQSVVNLATSGTYVLYAVWGQGYTVAYNGNGATSGTMPSEVFTREQSKNLAPNAYAQEFTVSFSDDGGTFAPVQQSYSSTFGGWALSADGNPIYQDGESVVDIDNGNGSVILYAVWEKDNTAFPDVSGLADEDWTFDGWVNSRGEVYGGDETVPVDRDETYRASWHSNNPSAGNAYAILLDDDTTAGYAGELVFVRSRQDIANGSIQTLYDLNGDAYHGTVYSGVETLDIQPGDVAPWAENPDAVTSVRVAPNTEITPVSFARWFAGLSSLQKVVFDGFNVSGVSSMEEMFRGCSSLDTFDLQKMDVSSVVTASRMFSECENLRKVSFEGSDFTALSDTSSMFDSCRGLSTVNFGDSILDAPISNASSMFARCDALVNLALPFRGTALENATNMFADDLNLRTLDISTLSTSALENADGFFTGASKLNKVLLGEDFMTGDVNIVFPAGSPVYNTGNWTNGGDYIAYDQFLDEYRGDEDMAGTWVLEEAEGLSSYPLDLDPNGGTLVDAPASYQVFDGLTIPEPERPGFTFVGWTGSNGDTPQKNVYIRPGSYGSLYYQAQWEPIQEVVNVKDTRVSAKFFKLDATSNEPISGAVFSVFKADREKIATLDDASAFEAALENAGWDAGLYDESALEKSGFTEVAEAKSTADGFAKLPYDNRLGQGIYAVVETTPPAGYLLPDEPLFYTFEVDENTPSGEIISVGFPMGDRSAPASDMEFQDFPQDVSVKSVSAGISLKKQKEDGEPLDNAEFTIWAEETFLAAVDYFSVNQPEATMPEVLDMMVNEYLLQFPPVCEITSSTAGIASTSKSELPIGSRYYVYESLHPAGYSTPEAGPLFYIYDLTDPAVEQTIITKSVGISRNGTEMGEQNDTVVVNVTSELEQVTVDLKKVIDIDRTMPSFAFTLYPAIWNGEAYEISDHSELWGAMSPQTVANDEHGNIHFELPSLPTAGQYIDTPSYFIVKETGFMNPLDVEQGRWELDTSEKLVIVTIKDDGFQLYAEVEFPDGDTFTNHYKTTPLPNAGQLGGWIIPLMLGALALVVMGSVSAYRKRKSVNILAKLDL